MTNTVVLQCASCKRTHSVRYEPWTFAANDVKPLLNCGSCGAQMEGRTQAFDERHRLVACAACGSPELYLRKTFPKWAGIGVVALAAAATLVLAGIDSVPPWAKYSPLFAAAAVDAILYFTTADAAACYRCGAMHRGCAPAAPLKPFDLEHSEQLKHSKPSAPKERPKPRV